MGLPYMQTASKIVNYVASVFINHFFTTFYCLSLVIICLSKTCCVIGTPMAGGQRAQWCLLSNSNSCCMIFLKLESIYGHYISAKFDTQQLSSVQSKLWHYIIGDQQGGDPRNGCFLTAVFCDRWLLTKKTLSLKTSA